MSLLEEAKKACVRLIQADSQESYGGYTSEFTTGEPFDAAIVYDSSTAARVASTHGVRDHYTVITDRDTVLSFHDLFQRVEDGKVFRVTTNGDENATPESAGLDMRAVRAEEWEVPNG